VENFVETTANTGDETTVDTAESIVTTGTNDIETGTIETVSTPTDEFGFALQWMYTNGMTKYNNPTDFRAND
jgi:hypothetical protein